MEKKQQRNLDDILGFFIKKKIKKGDNLLDITPKILEIEEELKEKLKEEEDFNGR